MRRMRIVLGSEMLARYPEGGGHWAWPLQYPLGLKALGHDVFWMEVLRSTGDGCRDQQLIQKFFSRMKDFGLEEQCFLLLSGRSHDEITLESAETYGKDKSQIKEIARTSNLLWNFACSFRRPLLSLFERRVLIDVDPGHLHVSALTVEMGIGDHQMLFTVGCKVHDPDCQMPTLGMKWHPFLPIVYLPMWPFLSDPGSRAPFSSITQWNWGELWLEDRVLSISKRDAYLRYLELPLRSGRPFELAANIHAKDKTGDRELLQNHGWRLVDPHSAVSTPMAYQHYIQRSRAELSCPKPIYRELKSGWLSDRSAAYLASGRPVLAEDTGFGNLFPTGEGLIIFRDLEEAVEGVGRIDRDYTRHSRAARVFAEEFLDSEKTLKAMLATCEEIENE